MTETNTDRHPKWQRVEPGTVIPAGQPFMRETILGYDVTVTDQNAVDHWFVDSSWKPPLVLPTEPTWGISVRCNGTMIVDQAHKDDEKNWQISGMLSIPVGEITDFIPLTDEQVARIEAAR